MEQVALKNVRKTFGSFVAVDDLSLTIESGEFVSVLGPSGCGKTTTLRMLAGLEQPSAGEIRIGNRNVNNLAPSARDIAMVFQSYALYPHMTVAQNIEYPLRKRRIPRADRPAMVAEAARLLQLEKLLHRKPRELSGGQQQRVALGRALVRNPAVFLLDEPLSNLDAKLRAHMRVELIELRARIGKTMIYVTHDQLEAMTMSDRIAVLAEGRLKQFASSQEVYSRPANRFVAGFIGTPAMNFIEGRLAGPAASPIFRAEGLEITLPPGHVVESASASGWRAVSVGIRPEDVILSQAGEAATVRLVEPTGHETIVFFDLDKHALIGRVGPDLRLRPGEAVRLSFRLDRIHVFAADTGERLNADVAASAPTAIAREVRHAR